MTLEGGQKKMYERYHIKKYIIYNFDNTNFLVIK